MRKGIVAAIAALSVVILAIVAFLVLNIFFGFNFAGAGSAGIIGGADGPTAIFVASSGDRELLLDETFPADGVQNVSLRLGSEDIDIFASEDGNFRVVQYGVNLREDQLIEAEVDMSTLTVRKRDGDGIDFFFGFHHSQSWVEIYVPDGYAGDMSLGLSSGAMRLNRDLALGALDVNVSSGSFRTENSIKAEDAELELTSGELSLGALDAAAFDVGVSSGNFRARSIAGSGALEVTSGELSVDSVTIAGHLETKVSSGSLRVAVADDPSLAFTGKESSGSLRTYFEKYYKGDRRNDSFAAVGDGPYKKLTAEVTSGSLRIDGSTAKQSAPGEGVSGDIVGDGNGAWNDEDERAEERREEQAEELAEMQEELEEQKRELEEQQEELAQQQKDLEERMDG